MYSFDTKDEKSDDALVGDSGEVVAAGTTPPPPAAQNDEDEDDEEFSYDPSTTTTPLGCGIFGKYPITALLGFVAFGLFVGIGLSYWRPETPAEQVTKTMAIQWFGLFGVLFLRALKCIILPMVFVNVILAVLDMMRVGAAGGIGGKTVVLYVITTVMAGIIGVVMSLIFQRWYTEGTPHATGDGPASVQLGCTLTEDVDATESYLVVNPITGMVQCESTQDYTDEMMAHTYWNFNDVNGTFATNTGNMAEVTLSDIIYDGVFMKLITDNIFKEFVDMNFAAIVTITGG